MSFVRPAGIFLLACLLSPLPARANEEIIFLPRTPPPEARQTKDERVALQDEWMGQFLFSFARIAPGELNAAYNPSPAYDRYLGALHLEKSSSYFSSFLPASFQLIRTAFGRRAGIYINIPFDIVSRPPGPLYCTPQFCDLAPYFSNTPDLAFAVGDASAGFYVDSLPRRLSWANLQLRFDANSNLSQYSSLGDGLWGLTPSADFRIGKSVYLVTTADYTHKLVRESIKPGGVLTLGAGPGFLWRDRVRIETTLKSNEYRTTYARSKGVSGVLFPKGRSLMLNVAFTEGLIRGQTIQLYVGGLEKGGSKSFGMSVAFTLF